MTMPHLMNCPHMGDGWCLDCVAEQWEQLAALRKDAERYRWLRGRFDACAASCSFADDDSGKTWRDVQQCNDAGPALDAAIEAAMSTP